MARWKPLDINYRGPGSYSVLNLIAARSARSEKVNTWNKSVKQACYRALIVNEGADPNTFTYLGLTPLMHEAATGNTEAVRFLLQHGADPNLKGAHPCGFLQARGSEGKVVGKGLKGWRGEHTAEEWASHYGHTQLAALLKKAAAQTRYFSRSKKQKQ